MHLHIGSKTMANASHDSINNGMINGFVVVHREEIEECQKYFLENGIQGAISYINAKNEEWKYVPLNIGITGCSGAGKSKFINAIRRIQRGDPRAAVVGVTEQTMKPTPYSHPDNEMLKFWDLPGVGTKNFPRQTYLQDIGFDNYDFFIVITHSRFTENDIWLCNEIRNRQKKFFFVRTKVQQDIENDRQDYPEKYNSIPNGEQELLLEIRKNIRENLVDLYSDSTVFLIDSFKVMKYDFSQLEQRLIEDFPEIKRQTLIFTMGAFTEEMIKSKVNELRSRIWKAATLSAAVATVPVPGISAMVDLGIIISQGQFYLKQLGLDDASIERFSKITNRDSKILNDIVIKNINPTRLLTTSGVKELLVTLPIVLISEATEEVLSLIPFIGALIAGPLSYNTTKYVLDLMLKMMEETSMEVIHEATKKTPCELDESLYKVTPYSIEASG